MERSLNYKYGLKQVINASGRMSILGVSSPTDTVMDAMKFGGQNYVEIADLVDKSGQYIAQKIKAEDAVVVNSASSGIALSVASVVTKGDKRKSQRLHNQSIQQNEIILFKGHNVQYGAPIETMVYLGGGDLVEVGYANEGKEEHIESAINQNTAAILFVKSHHAVQKNMASVEEIYEVAQRNNIPLIVDAAAEEDLEKYIQHSDLAIYSGSKAIQGPTTGIVAGKKEWIDSVKIQLHFIGRSMKVGKESVFGLLQAIDEYYEKVDHSKEEKETLTKLDALNQYDGINVSIVQDEAGREIYRSRIKVDDSMINLTAEEVVNKLKNAETAIYTRDYGVKQGYFDIDPRPLKENEIDTIYNTMVQILEGEI
ncbi:DgaE family pyridoxal phosphate-dependent ammonia lyase [Mammaliicoccus sciuri]|uniref:DgaE family pyridoxal phosphate-dependent ammonia lyase n=1 Tax=Mammaliicoccus sciuri TaxID=1296 RepID=UPI001E505028|nr:DgaE family pyridoxal phosphate-dependent ammonia lyase [Mammaliicoccus sciuri]MCD3219254.1 DgaE family pyridoxal phosphate-dependent ammonia lyase [Mammaliicoccus sciuri]MCJ0908575.1 DgaE family pyridoxal phosphate-dependent ammonia lyase [Mammaliicoccus sciuri]MDO0951063.1 DgaE family pyridoxal phosphate-dependent ammonia lyase [Mammaliicoccus sciuri]MEB6120101.1 DgaE family pyridoxal phosphate-dependent ammonia lyase [Mammaliicoccus sciuri]UXU68351.1 DgaE family pyridoxal phosphate-depen